eukprot:gene9539-19833_t
MSNEDDNKPSWLESQSGSNPVATINALNTISSRNVNSTTNIELDLGLHPDEVKKIQRWNMVMRFLNLVATTLMSAAAVKIMFLTTGTDVATGFIAVYVFFFAIVLFFFECAFPGTGKFITQNFGFMYSIGGRTIFLCLVAGMCARLDVLGYVSIGLIALTWIVFVAVRCKHPKYEEFVRRRHYYNSGTKKTDVAAPAPVARTKRFGMF